MSKKSGKNYTKQKEKLVEGIFYFGKNGVGFVRSSELDGHVIEIPAHSTGQALHKDTVRVAVRADKKSTGYIGKVKEVLRRSKKGFVGILEVIGDRTVIKPIDRHNKIEIVIPPAKQASAQLGQKVFVEIIDWGTFPLGEVTKVFEDPDSIDTVMQSFALGSGFDEEFPEDVLAEAEALEEKGITDEDRQNRLDIRNIPTFTIDPDDAKDFDDALSFEYLDDGNYKIGIHIADVSHYVTPGSALDTEAQERGTSVYLVDRTVPMLPEALSNNLCSLRPEEEKLAYSVVFTMTPAGEITDTWYGRTLIESNKRFTYEEAQEGIESGSGPHGSELQILNTIAKKYHQQRINDGALTLEKDEVRFVLDENGNPLEVRLKSRKDAHKMIEEFMLLANRYVATYLSESAYKEFTVYRVHDRPEAKRVNDLKKFLTTMNYEVPIRKGVIPSDYLRKIVEEAPNNDIRDALSLAIARSMAKAIYTQKNIGHYGLAFTYYTHFTSPIRRYPDVMVHRLLSACLEREQLTRDDFEAYESLAIHSTERERDAAEAERTSIHYMQARYMENKIGQEFDGIITGMTKHGVFVAERQTKCEGFAPFRKIEGDDFDLDEENNVVRGFNTAHELRLGDIVHIKLLKVDVENRFIDYQIILDQDSD